MKNTFRNIIASSITAMSISGCATLVQNEAYKIEKINSEQAKIGHVSVQSDKEKGTYIRGKLTRQFSNQGRIGGHIHIDVISQNGKIIIQEIVNHRKPKPRVQYSQFYSHIENKSIPNGSIIRIKHDNEDH